MPIQTVQFLSNNCDFIFNMFDISEDDIASLCDALEQDFEQFRSYWTPWAYVEYIFAKLNIKRETMFMTDLSNMLSDDGWTRPSYTLLA